MLSFSARPGQKRVMAENTVQESCPETGIPTNGKTCISSLKNWEGKVLSKVWGLQPSFQWIQDCLHQALFLQSVNHFSLSENHWDHSAVGISDTSSAKNTKTPKSTMCCQFWTWLLHCLHLLTKSRSRCWYLSDQSVWKCRTGPTLKNLLHPPFIPNSKYLTSPVLLNNGSL